MSWNDGFKVWLSESKSLENAQQVVNYLFTADKDWSKESIAALLGNMRHESSINPNMYEYGYDWEDDRGYGIVQWTPRSKFWDWAVSQGLDPELGESQLARIDYEVENNIQWIAADKIDNLTFTEFRTNSRGLMVEELTAAFTWGYERPNTTAGQESMPERVAFALTSFETLNWDGGGSGSDQVNKDEVINIVNNGKDRILNEGGNNDNQLSEIENLFNPPLFFNSPRFYSNLYLKMTKTYENLMKINPTMKMREVLKEIIDQSLDTEFIEIVFSDMINEINQLGGGSSTEEKVFPVKIVDGINFWKRENWGEGTLQRNMCYGIRSNGDWHYGYDIGGGGVTHPIYSVTNCTVLDVGFLNGLGNYITVKNKDDEYYIQYGHLTSYSVGIGDEVTAGEEIGIMGDTGGGYAIHLDIKISTEENGFYNEATTIDPEPYIGVTNDNTTTLPQP